MRRNMKICNSCGLSKSNEKFGSQYSTCKQCKNEYNRKRYNLKKKSEKQNESNQSKDHTNKSDEDEDEIERLVKTQNHKRKSDEDEIEKLVEAQSKYFQQAIPEQILSKAYIEFELRYINDLIFRRSVKNDQIQIPEHENYEDENYDEDCEFETSLYHDRSLFVKWLGNLLIYSGMDLNSHNLLGLYAYDCDTKKCRKK